MWWLSEVTAGEEESFSAMWKKVEGDASASEVNLERHQVSASCLSRSYVRQTVTGGQASQASARSDIIALPSQGETVGRTEAWIPFPVDGRGLEWPMRVM